MDSRTLLADAYELFILDCQAQRFTDATLRYYRGRLVMFLAWCDDNDLSYVDEITPKIVRQYLVSVDARGVSAVYLRSHAQSIKSMFACCVRDGLLDASPMDSIRMPRAEHKILPALTADEVRRALAACKNWRDRAMVQFLLDSGVRARELCALNREDVTPQGAVLVKGGKGRKDRTAMIGPQTQKALKRYDLERGDYGDPIPLLITQRGGRRLSYNALQLSFKRLQDATGIKHLNAHTCRRTFAINALRAGMPEHVLAQLMGHTTTRVLRQYLDITLADLREMHSRHNPMSGL